MQTDNQQFKELLHAVDAKRIIHITKPSQDEEGCSFVVTWVKDAPEGRKAEKDKYSFQTPEDAMKSFEYSQQYFMEG